MVSRITDGVETFFGTDGTPLEAGYIYIGAFGQNAETSPAQVYLDAELTIPISQPLRTIQGKISNGGRPVPVYISGSYSITVRARTGELVYTMQIRDINAEVQEAAIGYASRADAIASTVPENIDIIAVQSDAGIALRYRRDPNGTALTTAGGDRWSPADDYIHVEHFGAVGDYVDSASPGTDDTAAIQAAISYISTLRGGTLRMTRRYRTSAPIVITAQGLKIIGSRPERTTVNTDSVLAKGVIAAGHTAGPAVWLQGGDTSVENITVTSASTARSSAAISTGAGNINCGVLVEPPDTSGALCQGLSLTGLMVRNQPADGVCIQGDSTDIVLTELYTINNGRHGVACDNGQLSGRVNTGRPGIITMVGGKAFDNKGHSLAIGHPSSGAFVPYRFLVLNHESFRNATSSTVRYVDRSMYVSGENVVLQSCASGGTNVGNVPARPPYYVSGRDISLRDCRYISAVGSYIDIDQHAGLSTRNVCIDGGVAVTTGGGIAHFATLAANAVDIDIRRISHDASNPVTAMAVDASNQGVYLSDASSNVRRLANSNIDLTTTDVTGPTQGALCVISGGAISLASPRPVSAHWYCRVDTEASAASDDLDTISGVGLVGDLITLMNANSGRVVTVRDNTGNIRSVGDFNFASSGTVSQNTITLMYTGSFWVEISRSFN